MEENRNPNEYQNEPTIMSETYVEGTMIDTRGSQDRPLRASWRDASPDEVREMMRERVAKGIAAVTGALEGFIERTRQGDLAHKTREAISQAGETTREVISQTGQQMDQTRQSFQQAGIKEKAKQVFQQAGSAAREVTSTVKEEAQRTRQEVGAGQGGSSSSGSSMGMGNAPSGMGGGQPGPKPDIPDIGQTALGTQEDIRRSRRQS